MKIQTPRKKYTNLARTVPIAILNQKGKQIILTRPVKSKLLNTTYSGTTNIPETKNNKSSRNNNKPDSKNNEINLINNYNIENYSTSNYTDTTNSNSKNEHIQKYK